MITPTRLFECKYPATTPFVPAFMVSKRRTTKFSPVFAISLLKYSSKTTPFIVLVCSSSCVLIAFDCICCVVVFTKFIKFSFLATKSVSEFISLMVAVFSSALTATFTKPSLANLSAFLAALPSPFSRKISTALLISPSASLRAFLQSIIPAPVLSRSSFTICAVISAIIHLLQKTLHS